MDVRRNDAVTPREAASGRYAGIVISPGPGRPERAGVTEAVVRDLGGKLPILGVCLGHQAIGHVAGSRVVRAPVLMHGKSSEIHHDGASIYRGMPNPFPAARYHSLVVERESVPSDLEITATSGGLVMGLRRRGAGALLEGVQFHPESILTTCGMMLMSNYLDAVAEFAGGRPELSA